MRHPLAYKLKKRTIYGIAVGLLGAALGGLLGAAASSTTGAGPDSLLWNGWPYAWLCAKLVAIPAFIVGFLIGLLVYREKTA